MYLQSPSIDSANEALLGKTSFDNCSSSGVIGAWRDGMRKSNSSRRCGQFRRTASLTERSSALSASLCGSVSTVLREVTFSVLCRYGTDRHSTALS